MPALQLAIAPAAKNDLKDIYQYGLRQWGKAQSDNYLATIKDQFWSLSEQPLMGIECHCGKPVGVRRKLMQNDPTDLSHAIATFGAAK